MDAEDSQAQIRVFLATGTRRVRAREAVQAGYGALAAEQDCGCAAPAADPEAEAGQQQGCCTPGGELEQQGCCTPENTSDVGQQQGCCAQGEEAEPRHNCCTPKAAEEPVQFATGYTAAELREVPAEAAEFSLGCGNPVLLAALQQGETVLDIGSGGGIDCFYAARQVGPAGRVIGLDMTPEMIARAQDSARRAGLENVTFRLGTAEAMPVEDGKVDVILSNCVINLCEDKGQVFAEAHRVLQVGGRLVVSDMVTAGPLPLALRGRGDLWAGCVMGALSESEYVDLIKQAGFGQVEVRRSDVGGMVEGVRVYSALVTARK